MTDHEPAHGIRVVVRRTGLNADTIRAWERRYGAVQPGRSDGGRRLYSDAEIDRLLLLRRVTDAGRRISDVADLGDDELRELVDSDAAAERRARDVLTPAGVERRGPDAAPLTEALSAVERLDGRALEDVLVTASRDLPVQRLLEELVMPLLRDVGEAWRAGELRVAHEHLATAVVRSFLDGLRVSYEADPTAPLVVTATPTGNAHELGALAAAVVAELAGWRATYLGPNVPAADIAHAAASSGARLVALSIVLPFETSRVAQELRMLRRLLPSGVGIVVGGSGAGVLDRELDDIDVRRVDSLDALRDELTEAISR